MKHILLAALDQTEEVQLCLTQGICDYYGVDPEDIDIMMGTFTKSFGATGGYIAASKKIIDYLRLKNHSSVYAESIPVPILRQITTSMKIILGEIGNDEGRMRIQNLARNTKVSLI